MNAERVSIGEMGGRGMGHWEGVPMAFLVRMVLEEADTLDRGIAIFRDHPRTCEYYFVLADGKTGKAVGMEACWNVFGVIAMGESHPRLPHADQRCGRPLGRRSLQGARQAGRKGPGRL